MRRSRLVVDYADRFFLHRTRSTTTRCLIAFVPEGSLPGSDREGRNHLRAERSWGLGGGPPSAQASREDETIL